MEQLKQIEDWLRKESDKCLKQAAGRRDSASAMKDATVEELRAAKRLAEKMAGRKLPRISTDVKSANEDAQLQDRIATKLESEALQFTEWADHLASLTNKTL